MRNTYFKSIYLSANIQIHLCSILTFELQSMFLPIFKLRQRNPLPLHLKRLVIHQRLWPRMTNSVWSQLAKTNVVRRETGNQPKRMVKEERNQVERNQRSVANEAYFWKVRTVPRLRPRPQVKVTVLKWSPKAKPRKTPAGSSIDKPKSSKSKIAKTEKPRTTKAKAKDCQGNSKGKGKSKGMSKGKRQGQKMPSERTHSRRQRRC